MFEKIENKIKEIAGKIAKYNMSDQDDIYKNAKKKLVIVKNGNHSLSSPKWLKLL